MAKHKFRVVQGCPCPINIAPYIEIVTQDAKAMVNSIYRGADAERLLNAHGHSSQRQLYTGWIERRPGYLPANPPGFSTHELRSDGVAYPSVPRSAELPWWCQGFDVNDADVPHVKAAAARYGWEVWQPYSSGSEVHHLNFRRQPRPTRRTAARIVRLRLTLPRH